MGFGAEIGTSYQMASQSSSNHEEVVCSIHVSKRYALYRRVSTSMQADRDLSLPEQAVQQHDYVARAGGIIANEYEDAGISGSSADARPAFQEMIASAKRGEFDIILVHKSDRAFRNKDEASAYRILTQKIGIGWASVTEAFFGSPEPTDKLLTGIMESVSEFYTDNLKAETRKGLRAAATLKGRQNGAPPYGYCYKDLTQRGSGWEIEPCHSVWLQRIFTRFAEGTMTLRGLTQWANSAGIPLPMARITPKLSLGWNYTTLRRILTNRTYLGVIQFNGEWYPGSHPALITEETFSEVQAIFQRREGRREDAKGGGIALFAGGLLRCPLCRDAGYDVPLMIRGTSKYLNPRLGRVFYTTYSCRAYETRIKTQKEGAQWAGHSCTGYSISESVVIKNLTAAFAVIRPDIDKTLKMHPPPILEVKQPALPKNQKADIARIHKELAKIERLRDGYSEQAALGYMDYQRLGELLAKLDSNKKELDFALTEVQSNRAEKVTLPNEAHALVGNLKSSHMSRLAMRDALSEMFSSIIIQKATGRVEMSVNPNMLIKFAEESGTPLTIGPTKAYNSFTEMVREP